MTAHLLAWFTRLFTGAWARWRGWQPDAPKTRVFFANHTSHLDFVLLWSTLPRTLREQTRPAAALDYWGSPLRRRIAEGIFRAVLIERQHVNRSSNPLQQLLAAMQDGSSIILFPEGTRGSDPLRVGAFKGGLWHLAKARPDAEFVPVHIENLSRVLPKGEILPVPFLCRVTFGPPLPLHDSELKTDFLHRAREAVCQLQQP